jgi:hypothetical protein
MYFFLTYIVFLPNIYHQHNRIPCEWNNLWKYATRTQNGTVIKRTEDTTDWIADKGGWIKPSTSTEKLEETTKKQKELLQEMMEKLQEQNVDVSQFQKIEDDEVHFDTTTQEVITVNDEEDEEEEEEEEEKEKPKGKKRKKKESKKSKKAKKQKVSFNG